MKFYKCEADYMAIIWAKNCIQAICEYNEKIEEIADVIKAEEMDTDDVFQMMIDGGFDGDRESMAIGQIGELYKIITSKEPIVVIQNCD